MCLWKYKLNINGIEINMYTLNKSTKVCQWKLKVYGSDGAMNDINT